MRPARLAVVLVAHGSKDPRAAISTRALAEAVAGAHPEWEVHESYLDHAGPRPLDVLAWLSAAGHRRAVLVPLLLTAAYHGRVDVPAVATAARTAGLRIDVEIADILGPVSTPLVDGLIRRLPEGDIDAVVLAAAGTRNAAARATVADAAAELGRRLGVPCEVAYASAAPPTAAVAVSALRAAGASRVGMAAYFLAPGLLYDVAVESALSAGAVAIAPPLGDAPELVRLVTARVGSALSRRLVAA
ncbi:MAG TPA: CbiX/SirB N-terminal domain-containing protein [Actinoplanes sp.]|nr:CbiX/SirB N-terminal domain-containing protein [Actinoplanes sp.]